ncbi:hypothetical protein [Hyphococcus lacteus]|uniref:Uncharacterized protein n=1 Tax=Hyphococcus lacteus TaxID=3143536 RepID=A0ABV3Z9E0_9PROT
MSSFSPPSSGIRFAVLPVIILAFGLAVPTMAQQYKAEIPTSSEGWPAASFEVFRIAPGKHEAFVRRIAKLDEVLAVGGQPPLQLFFHDSGSDWDVLIFKPISDVKLTSAQKAAMAAKRKELGLPAGGPASFVALRKNVASHTDTKAYGPVSAQKWLDRLDQWRKENGVE